MGTRDGGGLGGREDAATIPGGLGEAALPNGSVFSPAEISVTPKSQSPS